MNNYRKLLCALKRLMSLERQLWDRSLTDAYLRTPTSEPCHYCCSFHVAEMSQTCARSGPRVLRTLGCAATMGSLFVNGDSVVSLHCERQYITSLVTLSDLS